MLAISLKHAFKTRPTVRAQVHSTDGLPHLHNQNVTKLLTVHNRECWSKHASYSTRTSALAMASAKHLTVTLLARSAIKNLTELLTVHNQKCWRNH